MAANDWVDLTEDAGVRKRIVRAAPPSAASPSDSTPLVDLQYEGRLQSEQGDVFDTTRVDNSIFTFQLKQNKVIKAWEIAVATMKVGEVAQVLCAPEYAYGAEGAPPEIPPNATLWFEVELKDVRPPKGAGGLSSDMERLAQLRLEREEAAKKREAEAKKREEAKAAAAARLASKGQKGGGKGKKK